MSDTISRKRVINALKVYFGIAKWEPETGDIVETVINDSISIIERLPAAQPDGNVLKWIPCSERFPEEDKYYLVTLGGDNLDHGRDIELVAFKNGAWEWMPEKQVLAWMELPNPWEASH